MGKQINFYMSKNVQAEFIKYLKEKHYLFLSTEAKTIYTPNSAEMYSIYLYKQEYGDVIFEQDYVKKIDVFESPIIQFKKTTIKEEQKQVLRGRIWIADQFYEENKLVKKKDEFIRDYKDLVRWIKRNVPYQKVDEGGYIISEYINDEIKLLREKGFILTM